MQQIQLGRAAMDAEDPNNHNIIPGIWRNDNMLVSLDAAPGNTSAKVAKVVWNYLRAYYSSPAGNLPWQDNVIRSKYHLPIMELETTNNR